MNRINRKEFLMQFQMLNRIIPRDLILIIVEYLDVKSMINFMVTSKDNYRNCGHALNSLKTRRCEDLIREMKGYWTDITFSLGKTLYSNPNYIIFDKTVLHVAGDGKVQITQQSSHNEAVVNGMIYSGETSEPKTIGKVSPSSLFPRSVIYHFTLDIQYLDILKLSGILLILRDNYVKIDR